MRISLPDVLALDEKIAGNPIRQLAEHDVSVDGDLATFRRGRRQGLLFQPSTAGDEILVVSDPRLVSAEDRQVIRMKTLSRTEPDLRSGSWLKHPLREEQPIDYRGVTRSVHESWADAFFYVQEDRETGVVGLRTPQIGAIHAVHAHWATTSDTGTIVMPTGTGKTDTMIAILISQRCSKLLIVVPTDALRTQIADKFLALGVLKAPGSKVLAITARYPIVATLHHIPRSVAQTDEVFSRAQVIVTTSSIAGQCDREVQERMAYHCPYLFIDEAHHAEAPTWKAFKEKFRDRRVLQFTATPFREDGKLLDGQIIFRYPLRKAQEEGYFKPIRFVPINEFSPRRVDAAIAAKAVEQLRVDADKGHILMARVDSVARAKEVFELYRPYTEFDPIQLHTGVRSREREAARGKLINGESRIVVCVDMLGEGFDLPELKIAAFHDIRKTLAVTLQLAGRFTRARPDLGDPTFIANIVDVNVQEELRKLYARDPDWNVLLPDLSERLITEQVTFQEFLRGFGELPDEIPLKSVRPATSAVVYRTRCKQWSPTNYRDGIPGINACQEVRDSLNPRENTLIVVTAKRTDLPWIESADLSSWEWDLYVLVWSAEQNLLYINSSANAGEYKALAHAICGEDAVLIKGQEVFRTFAGINRLRLQNVGLTEQLGRNIRYTGRMGSDVGPALSNVQRQRAVKSVLAGSGFENGERASVGASRRGRIWSHNRDNVSGLADWCKQIGNKLLDEAIDPDEVLKGTLEAETLVARPAKMPIAIDWPEEFYREPEVAWKIRFPGAERTLAEVSIELVDPSETGPLRFAITSEFERTEMELELLQTESGPNYRFVPGGGPTFIQRSGSSKSVEVSNFFYEAPPLIWFVDGSSLEGNQYVELKERHPPFDPAKIEAWDWADTAITNESQGPEKDATSIQARVIRELRNRDYAVIIDDDGKGEAADVVAARIVGEADSPTAIELEFYHCKYSSQAVPGHRVRDLYEVCGQAQKSISWLTSHERQLSIFRHLLHRDSLRREQGHSTRIEQGDVEEVLRLREIARLKPMHLKIFIVQPGLSKAQATRDQLQLLSVTEHHLMETYQVPFSIIASE